MSVWVLLEMWSLKPHLHLSPPMDNTGAHVVPFISMDEFYRFKNTQLIKSYLHLMDSCDFTHLLLLLSVLLGWMCVSAVILQIQIWFINLNDPHNHHLLPYTT